MLAKNNPTGRVRRHTALLLLSGGLDSMACLAYYRRAGYEVSGLFVDYGQPAAERERRSARAIARSFDCKLNTLTVAPLQTDVGEVRARNALLLTLGLMTFTASAGVIAIGIHAATPYVDCSPAFLMEMRRVFDLYTSGRIQPAAPFITWLKGDVYRMAVADHAPIELTYSCERGTLPVCGTCASCLDRVALGAC